MPSLRQALCTTVFVSEHSAGQKLETTSASHWLEVTTPKSHAFVFQPWGELAVLEEKVRRIVASTFDLEEFSTDLLEGTDLTFQANVFSIALFP